MIFFGALRYLKGMYVIGNLIYVFFDRNPKAFFVLAGTNIELELPDGTKKWASEYIKDKAKVYANRVIYFGKIRRCELYPVIKDAKACILPSRIENLSNACIEAMSLRKIVIATNGASYEQLIENNVNGFLCERDNAKDFLNTIEKVLNLEEDKKGKIELLAKQIVERLLPDNIYNKYIEYYEKVISAYI